MSERVVAASELNNTMYVLLGGKFRKVRSLHTDEGDVYVRVLGLAGATVFSSDHELTVREGRTVRASDLTTGQVAFLRGNFNKITAVETGERGTIRVRVTGWHDWLNLSPQTTVSVA
ncbi:MAG TPA: hypothetical protein VK545_24545 [Streptomyces sp.]|nr:hypothetical protein [Streptomyces sp.]